jgi:hypothetical protein
MFSVVEISNSGLGYFALGGTMTWRDASLKKSYAAVVRQACSVRSTDRNLEGPKVDGLEKTPKSGFAVNLV